MCLIFPSIGQKRNEMSIHQIIKNKFDFKVADVVSLEVFDQKAFVRFSSRDKLRHYLSFFDKSEFYYSSYEKYTGHNIELRILPDLRVVRLSNVGAYCNQEHKHFILDELNKYVNVDADDIFLTKWSSAMPYPVNKGVMALITARRSQPPIPQVITINGIKSHVERFF